MALTRIQIGARYRARHPEKDAERYKANKAEILRKQKIYYEANKAEILARNKRYLNSLPVDSPVRLNILNSAREYARKNPDKSSLWAKRNPEKRKAAARKYQRKLIATLKGRLDHRMSVAVGMALKGNKSGRAWEAIVGYSLNELKRHLETTFAPGMNWDRFMAGQIHIEHIIPKALFNYSDPSDKEFKQCWALTNLRPFWKLPNLSKGKKILKPSQLALPL